MLQRYLAARYALYCRLATEAEKDFDETGDPFYEKQMYEAFAMRREVSHIMDDLFGKPMAFEIRVDAHKWLEEVDIMTIYKTIEKYSAE